MHHRTCALLTSHAVIMASTFVITARADEVTDWNQYMLQAALVATNLTHRDESQCCHCAGVRV